MQELTLEKRCAALKGLLIDQVVYYGHQHHDALAHGISKAVYIRLSDGSLHRISFAKEFVHRWGHGITIKQVLHIFPEDYEEQFYDATSDWLLWANGSTLNILDTKLHWRYIQDSRYVLWPNYERYDYPQDIQLVLPENKSIFIGATKIINNKEIRLFTNHLTVFFSFAYHQECYERAVKYL